MQKKSEKIREACGRVWEERRKNKTEIGTGNRPVAILARTVNELGRSWKRDPLSFQLAGKSDLPFSGQEDSWWKHEVRKELWDMIWRNDKAARARTSFKGCEN